MKYPNQILAALLIAGFLFFFAPHSGAQLPANFPTLSVTTNYAPGVAGGYVFLADNLIPANLGYYLMIVGNDAAPIWYRSLTNAGYDFKVLPNGYLHYAQQIQALSYTGGGDVTHEILDENYNSVETITGGNGYVAEAHEFQMLPNGNVLQIGYYLSEVDMSQVVPGGNPAALVSGAVIQELDAQRTVVFQWRPWDHYPFTSNWVSSTAAVISSFHINRVIQDTDGHLIISTPDWVKKVNRQTGDIMWHLGGTENQFTFVGVSQAQGVSDFRTHAIERLANGHVLVYNNSLLTPGATSTVHEYALDETNKIATHIWTYTPKPAIPGPFQGDAQRLPNGNTFIGWGGLGNLTPDACTEISGTNVVFQMKFNNPNVTSYRATRSPYPPQSQDNQVGITEVAAGNTYNFGGTGVSVGVVTGGGGYNRLVVTRSPYAPLYPLFQDKPPRVLPVRVQLSELAVDALTVDLDFDVISFGLDNPASLTLAYRTTTGQGLFLPQATQYNPATGKLRVHLNLAAQSGDLGEFIFTYPDLADVAFPPLLAQVENYRGVQLTNVIAPKLAAPGQLDGVNQQLPILLSWSPKGFSRYFELQIGTESAFTNPLVQIPYQTDAFYVWNGATPGTTYFDRVRTWNDGGVGGWSVGSFRTTSPFITATVPQGGESWQRGLNYFVRWHDNIPENVRLELYRGGTLVRAIATNAPSSGAFNWAIPLDLAPGNNYSIRITSLTNSALFAVSPAVFSIDPPTIVPLSLAEKADGRFTFNISAPGSTQVDVLASTNLLTWQDLGLVPLVNGAASFTDDASTNYSRRFFRLRLP